MKLPKTKKTSEGTPKKSLLWTLHKRQKKKKILAKEEPKKPSVRPPIIHRYRRSGRKVIVGGSWCMGVRDVRECRELVSRDQ